MSARFYGLVRRFYSHFWRPRFSELFTRWPRSSLLVRLYRSTPSGSPRVIRSRPARTYVLGPFERVWQMKRDVKNPRRCCPQTFPRLLFRCTRFNEIIFPETRSISLRARFGLRPPLRANRPSDDRPNDRSNLFATDTKRTYFFHP